MSYMVLESHLSYAVVLDENGRFLKVANLNYEVGQTLEQVIEMGLPEVKRRRRHIWLAAAACVCMTVLSAWQLLLFPYGTVRLTINPEVEMTVSRIGWVTELEALNKDGAALIRDVETFGKRVETITGELVDRAAELDYLEEDGRIGLTVTSKHQNWKSSTEARLVQAIEKDSDWAVQVILLEEGEELPKQEDVSDDEDLDEDDIDDDDND